MPDGANSGFKRLETKADLEAFLDSFDTILLDCDGVLWRSEELVEGVDKALALFRKRGKKLAFVTNNATKSRAMYKEKFDRLGVKGVQPSEIFSSGSASAQRLATHILPSLPEGKRGIYVIGQEGLEDELASFDLKWTGGSDPADDVLLPNQDFSSIHPDPSIGVVLIGFDMRVNYKKYGKAYNYLKQNRYGQEGESGKGWKAGEGCLLVLTNDDAQVHTGTATCPGEGALAAPVIAAYEGKKPIVIGKPNQGMLDAVAQEVGFDRSRTVMVGDRLEIDIPFGKHGGLSTLFVLTGSSKEEDLETADVHSTPTFVLESLGRFADLE